LSQAKHGKDERLVYVMPVENLAETSSDEISLVELAGVLWKGRGLILGVTLLFASISLAYAVLATEWYQAEVLLAPAEEKTTAAFGGQLGGLAALAGVSSGSAARFESLAVLQSRDLAREFIEEFDLLRVFFADRWDEATGSWTGDESKNGLEIRDAVSYFHANVLRVSQDRQSGLVTVSIQWTNPAIAVAWADAIVSRANAKLRERALREAETNVAYLEAELARTSVVALQQSIGRLLESELEKLMLARGNDEFAFRVVDAAAAARTPVRPKRVLIVLFGTLLGGIVAMFVVMLRHAFSSRDRSSHPSSGAAA
jgi:uncharacterized protein involved in exopolysaccharide biosynthesis